MTQQRDLFSLPSPAPSRAFDGNTYSAKRDYERLTGCLLRVAEVMMDGRWHTLSELASEANASEASVSARLRDLRKPKYGKRDIERRHVRNGLHEYRLRSGT